MTEYITLDNGVKMPTIGLGTSGSGNQTKKAVISAIEAGYRHFDCAAIYMNEVEVGKAIEEKIADGSVQRQNLFIVNKLWSSFQHPRRVEEGLKCSLQNMGLDYFDLFLMHWPLGLRYVGPDLSVYRKEGGLLLRENDESVDFTETWEAMEQLYDEKLVRAIGVSNFNIDQLKRLLRHARVRPVSLHIECHPYLNQDELISFCKSNGIAVTGYSPFASPGRPWASRAGVKMLEDPTLLSIASKYDRSVAQIVLRYLIQLGVCVIPKSTSPERLRSNFDVLCFSLEKEDMETIKSLDRKLRMIPSKEHSFVSHKYFPFAVEELL